MSTTENLPSALEIHDFYSFIQCPTMKSLFFREFAMRATMTEAELNECFQHFNFTDDLRRLAGEIISEYKIRLIHNKPVYESQ